MYLGDKGAAKQKSGKNEPGQGGAEGKDDKANEEENGVDHQSLPPPDLVRDKAGNGGKDKMGKNPGACNPAAVLCVDREVEAEVEVEVKEEQRRACCRVEASKLLL